MKFITLPYRKKSAKSLSVLYSPTKTKKVFFCFFLVEVIDAWSYISQIVYGLVFKDELGSPPVYHFLVL